MANDIVIRKPSAAEPAVQNVVADADHPIVPGARRLTPMEMNSYHFADRPTVLTPDQLRKSEK